MTFRLKRHETQQGAVVAACDADLLETTVTDGTVTITVSEAFYGGETATIAEIQEALAGAETANLVGTALVDALIDRDVVAADDVATVDGVKHVQLVYL